MLREDVGSETVTSATVCLHQDATGGKGGGTGFLARYAAGDNSPSVHGN